MPLNSVLGVTDAVLGSTMILGGATAPPPSQKITDTHGVTDSLKLGITPQSILLEGFDHFTPGSTGILADLQNRWPNSFGTLETGNGRDNGTSLRFAATSGALETRNLSFQWNEGDRVSVGMAIKFDGSEAVFPLYDGSWGGIPSKVILQLQYGTNTMWGGFFIDRGMIGWNTSTSIATLRAGGAAGGNRVVMRPYRWYWVEAEVTIHPSNGTVDLYLDNVLIDSSTNVDTAATLFSLGSGIMTGVRINECNRNGNDRFTVDDIYINKGDRFGNVFIKALHPDSDTDTGSPTGAWTTTGANNFGEIDEKSEAVDDATTHISDTNVGNQFLVGMENTPPAKPITGIKAIQIVTVASQTAGENISHVIFEGATTTVQPSQTVSGSFDSYWDTLIVNPDTGAAWDRTEIDTIELGAQI